MSLESHRDADDGLAPPWFTIRNLLLATAAISVACGLLAAGWIGVTILYVGVGSLCLMIAGVVRHPSARWRSTVLLLSGMGYAGANIILFAVTMAWDRFAIFDLGYVALVAFVGPAATLGGFVPCAVMYRFPILSLAGFAGWTASVVFAHLWVIGVCSASV